MANDSNVRSFVAEHKTLLIIILVGLFLIELEIFALAVMKSGRKARLQILDSAGNVIHETDGRNLSQFDKYYFEKTFGPLENYRVRLQTRQVPFPFRAWFVAAVGIPVGAMLIFGFIVKAYIAIFHGEVHESGAGGKGKPGTDEKGSGLEVVLNKISRLNIFIIGFLVVVGVVSYWVIPNLIVYIGKTGIETIIRFKWFFLTAALVVLSVGLWIIYLRYLLAKKTIETRAEIEKYRLQLTMGKQKEGELPLQGPDRSPEQGYIGMQADSGTDGQLTKD